ncbi:MAG: FHA domain-containing protein [Candidatus Dormibacteria bacterium]
MSASGLLALRAPDGATVALERFPILLGRSVPGGAVPDVDVSHLDPQEAVDNRHLELDRVPAGLEVHDLGGIGGSWVDGRRLAPGARGLLEVGGTLRVGGVVLTLIRAPGALQPPPPRAGRESASPWLESGPAQGVPPPPSAGAVLLEEVEQPAQLETEGMDHDLSGAPVLAREALERGAELVRIRPGAQLEELGSNGWSNHGKPLAPGAVSEAVASVRRVLDLPEEVLSGEGHVGDVSLEFVVPPLTDRAYLSVQLAPRRPALLEPALLELARRLVGDGGTLLINGPWPEPALAALSEHFERSYSGTRVLSFGAADWWVPPGWPTLDPYHPGAAQEALRTGELFLDQPPDPILEALLRALPRPEGGTVLALRQPSLVGVLEQMARQLDPAQAGGSARERRAELARLLPRALSWQGRRWELCLVGVDEAGDWNTAPQRAGRGAG